MFASFNKCLRVIRHAVMPRTGLRALIGHLRRQPCSSKSRQQPTSLEQKECSGNEPQDTNLWLETADTPVNEARANSPGRVVALEGELELLRERVRDLECQMTEAMSMINYHNLPLYSPSTSQPPRIIRFCDSPLSMSLCSSRASVTDLGVPTPYAGSLDVARATSPAPTDFQFEVERGHGKNKLGLNLVDIDAPPLDGLATLEMEGRLGSHFSGSSLWSARSSHPDLLPSPTSLASQRSYPVQEDLLTHH